VPPARPAIAREPTSLTVADRAHRRRAPGCGRCHIWRNPTTSRSLYRGVSPALPSRRVPARPRKQGPHPRASGHLLLANSGTEMRTRLPTHQDECRGRPVGTAFGEKRVSTAGLRTSAFTIGRPTLALSWLRSPGRGLGGRPACPIAQEHAPQPSPADASCATVAITSAGSPTLLLAVLGDSEPGPDHAAPADPLSRRDGPVGARDGLPALHR
jgi:hypothetical protein